MQKLVTNLPDAEKPESDAYMTAHAIVLMRQNNVPVSDPRIQKALAWLKREQRETGRWWMHSLYRGNFHFITYIATVEAMKIRRPLLRVSEAAGQGHAPILHLGNLPAEIHAFLSTIR